MPCMTEISPYVAFHLRKHIVCENSSIPMKAKTDRLSQLNIDAVLPHSD